MNAPTDVGSKGENGVVPVSSPHQRPDSPHATGAGAADDDAALVAAARNDPRAFGALYECYLNPVYGYCYVRLGSREAAEDLTSEVFIKALAGLDCYRGGLFVAWLFRIARNVVIDAQRR